MDDNQHESSYQEGFRDGKQWQMNKQTQAFQSWVLKLFTAALFAVVAILVSMWAELLRPGAAGFAGGLLYSLALGNKDIVSITLGSYFGF
jgi:hypothetical protein